MTSGSNKILEELGERVIAALFEENTGTPYKRQQRIAERALDARIAAIGKPFTICQFSNKYGLCKLEAGHLGSHTVINLGNDDE